MYALLVVMCLDAVNVGLYAHNNRDVNKQVKQAASSELTGLLAELW
jgi:hypothetical protein